MLNKKKIIILAGSLIIILVIAIIILVVQKKSSINNETGDISNSEAMLAPEFMSAEEKVKRGLPADSKIQVFPTTNPDELVYKIIKRDADIVVDPSRVNDPTMIQPVKTKNQ